MKKLTALLIVSTLTLGATTASYATDTTSKDVMTSEQVQNHHKHKHGSHHDAMKNPMFKGLNLTDAQKQQIKAIMKKARGEKGMRMMDDRQAMHDLVTSNTFDKTKAEALVNKMSEQNKVRMLSHLEMQNKIYHILTPEQQKQFQANFEHHGKNGPKGNPENAVNK